MGNHILAFSSDRNMLHTLEFILEAERFTVSTSSNWAATRELLKHGDFSIHLMILDLVGSEGAGLQQITDPAIRDRDFPVIVLTGSLRGRGQRNTVEWQDVAWMEKPVDREDLLRTIKALLLKKDTGSGN